MIRSLVLMAALALPFAARAETPALAPLAPATSAPTTTPFLVMDSARLATEATAMQSVFDQMAKRHDIEAAAYKMAIDKLEKEFAPVREARDTIDPAEYQKAVDQYNSIKAQIDGVLTKVEDEMGKAGEKAIEQFNTVATMVGQQVRQDHGISRFVDGSAVLYIRDGSGYDATDEVIKRVNAKLPDIKVDFPERPKAAATEPAKPAAKKK
jgi:Skp family chaperone for outer membrane proteins